MPTSPMSPHARPERQAARSKLASLSRHHGPDDPAVQNARRDLHAARAKALLAAALDELDAAITPGTAEADK